MFIIGGCAASKASTPKIDAQKKVISTYLEGLRDGDKKKVLDSLNYSLAQSYVGNPDALTKILASQKALGSIQNWTFQDNTIYLDELNNQTLVTVTVKYPALTTDLKFDLRRAGGQWMVMGTDVVKQTATGKNYHGKANSKANSKGLNQLKQKMQTAPSK